MDQIDYSVVIRTTGKAHEKYQRLLESVNRLVPPPKEIIVVLPYGNSIPEEKIGKEKYFFCTKGMVIQRIIGMRVCKTKYALVCDDDVSFDSDFVCKLYKPIRDGKGCFSAGPLYSFLPPKGVNSLLCMLMGSAVPTLFHRDRYVSILHTSGYSYNRNLLAVENSYYETQSIPWTCFFAEIAAFHSLDLEREIWLDKNGYAAMDDQTMFYKAWLMGMKSVVVADAIYSHLDARTSTRTNKSNAIYASGFNRVVFWHRFIFKTQDSVIQKIWSSVCFAYKQLWDMALNLANLLRNRVSLEQWKRFNKGYADGWKYLKCDEYQNLPPIQRGKE